MKFIVLVLLFIWNSHIIFATSSEKNNQEKVSPSYSSKYQALKIGHIIKIKEENLYSAPVLYSGLFGSQPEPDISYKVSEISSFEDSTIKDWYLKNLLKNEAPKLHVAEKNRDDSPATVYNFEFIEAEVDESLRRLEEPSFFITSRGDVFGYIVYSYKTRGPFWLGNIN